jgi:hypothetical protein
MINSTFRIGLQWSILQAQPALPLGSLLQKAMEKAISPLTRALFLIRLADANVEKWHPKLFNT